MVANAGAATVLIAPRFSGFQRQIGQQMAGVGTEGEKAGRTMGQRLAAGARRAARVGMIGAGVAAGAALTGGIRAGLDMQKTEAALSGLLGSGSDAAMVMREIHDISRTSAIDSSAYYETAEALAYMGVEARDMPGILDNLGKMIQGAGGGSEEMNRASEAMLQMVNSGRVYTEQLNRMSDAGVPIFDSLAEHFGVSIAQVREMAQAGEIGVQDVLAVTETATGDIAKAQIRSSENVQKTASAQFATLKDNVATSLGTMFQPGLNAAAGFLASINRLFEPGGGGFQVPNFAQPLVDSLQALWATVRRVGSQIAGAVGDVVAAFAPLARDVGAVAIAALAAAFTALRPVMSAVGTVFAALGSFVRDNATVFRVLGAAVLGGVAAFKAFQLAQRLVMAVTAAARLPMLALAAAQRVVNVAMRANPIGVVVTALGALVAVLVYAWKNSETFRGIVTGAFSGIRSVVAPIISWFATTVPRVFSTVLDAIAGVFGWVRSNWYKLLPLLLGPIGAAASAIVIHWDTVKAAFAAAWGFIRDRVLRPLGTLFSVTFAGIRGVLSTFVTAVAAVRNAISAAWQQISARTQDLSRAMAKIFTAIARALRNAWNVIVRVLVTPLQVAWRGIEIATNVLRIAMTRSWQGLQQALGRVWSWISRNIVQRLAQAWALIQRVTNVLRLSVTRSWQGLQRALSASWMWIQRNVVDRLHAAWRGIQTAAGTLRTVVGNAWARMRDSLGAVWRSINSTVIAPLRNAFQSVWRKANEIRQGVVRAWNMLKDGTVAVFNSLKAAIKRPLNAVIGFVNDKIIGGLNLVTDPFGLTIGKIEPLNRGGVVPGSGPDRDSVPAALTPGESVFTRERTRELRGLYGRDAVDDINRRGWDAIGGASGGMEATDAFGGFTDWIGEKAGKAWNFTKAVTAGVVESLQTDPGRLAWAAFEKVLPVIDTGLKDKIKGLPDLAGKFPYGVFQNLKDKIKDWIVGKDEEEASAGLDFLGEFSELGKGKYGNVMLDAAQIGNAGAIMQVGKGVGATQRDIVIALMTAMQESTLRNIDYGHLDSLGLFQQRAAWGSRADRTNPRKSARMFFKGGQAGQRGLLDFKNRANMSLTEAAQAVQVSAFPNAYAKWADMAKALVAAAKQAGGVGRGGQVAGGRIMKAGTYSVGRGSAAHGYPSVDLPAPIGTPVYAPWAGGAARQSLTTSYGKNVRVSGINGLTFLGAHLSRHAGGNRVAQGQTVGHVGSTGNSTGPHLHAEVLRGGTRLEPSRYLKYDKGGWLPEGVTTAVNQARAPEPVLSQRQWRTAAAAIEKTVGDATAPAIDYDRLAAAMANANLVTVLDGREVGRSVERREQWRQVRRTGSRL